jgi:cytochrome c
MRLVKRFDLDQCAKARIWQLERMQILFSSFRFLANMRWPLAMRLMLIVIFVWVPPVHAQDALVGKGKTLADNNCAVCHAIGTMGDSPLLEAPPFRDVALNYDLGELQDAFNEGVATEHPVMPDWQMTPDQAEALAAFIMSLAPFGMKKTELVK